MGRKMVPFGTNPEDYEFSKGTIIVYDVFDDAEMVEDVISLAEHRGFEKVIFYPLHEKTVQRLDGRYVFHGYKNRIKFIESEMNAIKTDVTLEICKLDGKRKKYTPLDTALEFITEHHKGPHFLYISDQIANRISQFSSFEKWIKKTRFFIRRETGDKINPKLIKYENRWERV